jgi:1-acyl-sn-glycerol-3-phosphate acyltransferase
MLMRIEATFNDIWGVTRGRSWYTQVVLYWAVISLGPILLMVALGLTVRHRQRLPSEGPAVLAGNHNSNLDALAIMSLMPLRLLPKLRPVAAMDYFYTSRLRGWFANNIVGIIPVKRGSGKEGGNPLQLAEEALERGEILVIFPEGTRGEPETLQAFKKGIGHLARDQRLSQDGGFAHKDRFVFQAAARQQPVQAAAQGYFGKDVRNLDLIESATLCGLIKSPNNLQPLRYRDRCKKARNHVLDRMALGWIGPSASPRHG